MIDPRKARSYLLYATGEIILVVVGILIALQVNNWNEARVNEARLDALLRDIQADLVEDVRLATQILPEGARRDSILARAIAGEITREEYLAPDGRTLMWAGLQYMQFSQNRTAFDRLSAYEGIVPRRYAELLDLLEDLYAWESNLLNSRQEIFASQIEERHEYLSRTYPWYWLLATDQRPDDAMLDYYLNDPQYKSFARRFRDGQTLADGNVVQSYRAKAVGVYAAISGFLGEPASAPNIPQGLLLSDPDAFATFVGEYESDTRCCNQLSIRSGILYLNAYPRRYREGTIFDDPFASEKTIELRAEPDGAHVMTLRDGDEVTVWRRRTGG